MKIVSFVMTAIVVLGASVPAYAGSVHQDYTGIKTAMAGDAPFVQSTFDMIQPEKTEVFSIEAYDIGESTAKIKWSGDKIYLGYNIYKFNPITHGFEEYATTNTTNMTVGGLLDDSTYKFMVTSAVGEETLGVVSFQTKSLKPRIKVAKTSADGIELTFKNTYDASKLVVYRSDNDNDFEKIAVVDNATSFVDKDVKTNVVYTYKVKMLSAHNARFSNTAEAEIPKEMGLPNVSGATKTYAYYTAVTAKGSPQYALLNSNECYTDEKTGIRMIGGYYCVALGSFYGSTIGTRYRITFSTGKSIKVILCDQKSDRHTDGNHQYAVRNCDIMEFYVEKGKIPSNVRGNYGNLEQFSGDIVKIERYSL